MSKPRYGWWSYAKHMVRSYPALKREHDELHCQRITANNTGIPGAGNCTRTTENTALRQLPRARQRELDAVEMAIKKTKLLKTGLERLKLVDMVFWKQSHTLDGAAYALCFSYETAKQYHSDFIRLVGFCYGLEDVDEEV